MKAFFEIGVRQLRPEDWQCLPDWIFEEQVEQHCQLERRPQGSRREDKKDGKEGDWTEGRARTFLGE